MRAGANAGLGFEAAKELAAHKGHVSASSVCLSALLWYSAGSLQVIMAGRSQERCEQAIAEIKQDVGQSAKIDFLEIDLADFRYCCSVCVLCVFQLCLHDAAGMQTFMQSTCCAAALSRRRLPRSRASPSTA